MVNRRKERRWNMKGFKKVGLKRIKANG